MGNKLLVSTALLAAALAAASCEKQTSGEPAANQSGSATSERQTRTSQETAREEQGTRLPTDEMASQARPGDIEQPNQEQQDQQHRVAQVPTSKPKAEEDHSIATDRSGVNEGQDRTTGHSQESAPTSTAPSGASGVRGANGGIMHLGRGQIRQLQGILQEKGFDVGKNDGVFGPRTRNALIAFQRQHGLEPTGQTDQRTVMALGISSGAASTMSGQGGTGYQ